MLAVILSGGAGTRLWPVSRAASPKPFMRLNGGPSLLQRTLQRARAAGARAAIVVTNQDYRFQTQDDIDEWRAGDGFAVTLLLEPAGRNTAPAIAAAAQWATTQGHSDEPLLVLPADHLVQDEARFAALAGQAAALAEDGRIVLFGIRPTLPETGFGYIECAQPVRGDGPLAVARFVEKPDATTAAGYVASGRFLWNSGMFCFTPATITAALATHAPQVQAAVECALRAGATAPVITLDAAGFAAAPSVSIDVAVMEKAAGIVVLPGDFGWSDIGSWQALIAHLPADTQGNTSSGEVLLEDCRNTHVQSEDRIVAALGLTDVVVVDTPDALLVCRRDASQDVRAIVERLRARDHDSHRLHKTVARPWGSYTVLQEGPRFKIKRIEVKPGAALSLQMHHHRSEHWVVVSGTAKVTIDGAEKLVAPNESTFVPIGARHRLENPGRTPLTLIEVQCGDYVGEDDIVRLDDPYGRLVRSA
jgi:mannose-1-phosphate guanylyltransferase/mannose-6-phosphate isomerase